MDNRRISEIRQLLLDGPTCASWNSMVGLLDATPHEELPVLVDYLKAHMEDWDSLQHESWEHPFFGGTVPEGEPFWKSIPNFEWRDGMEPGEVRIAPYHWVEQMLEGIDSPKWSLVRQLHLKGLELNGKQGIHIVTRPSLTNLRVLTTQGNPRLSRAFYKTVRESSSMSRLVSLRVGEMDKGKAKGLVGDSTFQLERFGMECNDRIPGDALEILMTSKLLQDITLLDLLSPYVTFGFSMFFEQQSDAFPKLQELRHCPYQVDISFHSLQRTNFLQRVKKLHFGLYHTWSPTFATLNLETFPSLQAMNVRQMARGAVYVPLEEVTDFLVQVLEKSNLCTQLDYIEAGSLKTQKLEEFCQSVGIELRV